MGDRRGIIGLFVFSLILAVILGVFIAAIYENVFGGFPNTLEDLFFQLMFVSVSTIFITVFAYTYYLRGKVAWIYY